MTNRGNGKNFKRIVLLGHSGFIGRNLEKSLGGGAAELVRCSSSHVDLTCKQGVKHLEEVFDPDTCVIMCAAVKRQEGDTLGNYSRNLDMAVNLCGILERCPVGRFIFMSSTAVYGEDVQHGIITEETPPSPTSYYGAAKMTAEYLFQRVFSSSGGSLVIVRPPTVYGPGDTKYPYGPSRFARDMKEKGAVTLWGSGTEMREFIYIDDLVRFTGELINGNFEGVVNMVSGRSYTFLDVVDRLVVLFGRPMEVDSRPRSKAKVDNLFGNDRLRANFPGFEFTDLSEGIGKTAEVSG